MGKRSQKGLRLAIAGLMILLVILLEMLATPDRGISIHTTTGPRPFDPGMTRAAVLETINREKNIRKIGLCRPDAIVAKQSRTGIAMSDAMAKARIWTARARNQGTFFFYFTDDTANLILYLNDRENGPFTLFANCSADLIDDPLKAVRSQTVYQVFED